VFITKTTSQRFTFFTSKLFTISWVYVYQKDEWSLPGNILSRTFFCFPPQVVVSFTVPLSSVLFSFCSSVFTGLHDLMCFILFPGEYFLSSVHSILAILAPFSGEVSNEFCYAISLSQWCTVESLLRSLHCMDVGRFAVVSKAHAAYIFMVEVSCVRVCTRMYRFWSSRPTREWCQPPPYTPSVESTSVMISDIDLEHGYNLAW
jgi:hypothetical protein